MVQKYPHDLILPKPFKHLYPFHHIGVHWSNFLVQLYQWMCDAYSQTCLQLLCVLSAIYLWLLCKVG
jgi:hypothetical protein